MKKGEWVLNNPMIQTVKRMTKIMDAFADTPPMPANNILPDIRHFGNSSTISNALTTNNNNQSIVFNQGDVTIQGTVMGPKELAENINKYINMTEKMVNQYARLTGVKW